jgi:hypothetical protein
MPAAWLDLREFVPAPRPSAGLTDKFPATKAFNAFAADNTLTTADIAFYRSFLGGQLTCSLALIAFGRD